MTGYAGYGIRLVLVIALLLAAAGCRQESAKDGESGVDEQILIEMEAAFAQTVTDRDIDRFMSYWADDAAYLPHAQPILRGKDSIRQAWAQLFVNPQYSLVWRPDRAELAASGDLGYTYGEYRITRQLPGEEPRSFLGKYATIWRKEPDGAWKVVLDAGSPNQPPALPPRPESGS